MSVGCNDVDEARFPVWRRRMSSVFIQIHCLSLLMLPWWVRALASWISIAAGGTECRQRIIVSQPNLH